MDERDRQIIEQNISDLIQKTNYKRLMQRCLEEKILFDVMKQDIENSPYASTKHRMLFEKITRRGPDAFKKLKEICDEDFPQAAHILQTANPIVNQPPANNNNNNNEFISLHDAKIKRDGQILTKIQKNFTKNNNNNNNILKLLEPYTEPLTWDLNMEVKKSTKFSHHPQLSTYEMKSRNRGILFFVNIIDIIGEKPRNGATVDRNNLIYLFRQMNFTIFYYENIDVVKLTELIAELNVSNYVRHTDCLVFALHTHGGLREGHLFAKFTDGSVIKIEDIIEKFNNRNCQELVGKPKIFMFPFCRGNTPDPGVPGGQSKIESDSIPIRRTRIGRYPTTTDIRILYGSVPGYQTFRLPDTGSWYIRIFCQVFAEYAHEMSLDDMLKIIGEKVLEFGQAQGTGEIMTPSDENRGSFKVLYFNPGFYKDLIRIDSSNENQT